MADIKKLSIFSSNTSGLDRIKEEREKEKITPKASTQKIALTASVFQTQQPSIKQKKSFRGVGAPIKNYDKVYSTKQSVKVSAVLNSISRVLTEKYMSGMSRDEILRQALNEYIKQSLTKEDKMDLLSDVKKDLELFRQEHPTIEQLDENGNIVKSIPEIEEDTLNYLKSSWNL